MFGNTVKSVLVVAAHADDEALGCGGTIAALSAAGCAVRVVLMTDGVGARQPAESAEARERREAAERANQALGARIEYYGDLPDNQLDTVPLLRLVKIVEEQVAAHRPQVVFTHHAGDLNVDHQRVHQAVITACRPQPGHSVRGLLFFEVPSSTEWQPPGSGQAFLPNWFVDISATWPAKQAALQAYAAEMRQWPHARSLLAVEHLARWRGASIGTAAAEAFMLGRWLERE